MSKNHAPLDRRRWSLTRLRVFERDKYRCCRCGRAGRLEADHIEPLKSWQGSPFDLGNLQTLCRSCHIAKTAEENRKPVSEAQQKWRALISEMVG